MRKVVRSGATEFSHDRSTQPRPKNDPRRSKLDDMLAENARRPKRERLTLVWIYEELRSRRYGGSYDVVRRSAAGRSKATREATASAYVPLSFDPGEAYQFDWSHEVVVIDGATTTVKVIHVRLFHSGMPFVQAYPRATQEMVFDAQDRLPGSCPLVDCMSINERERLPSLAGPVRGASTIMRLGRHGSEARPNEDGGGHDLCRQGSRLQSPARAPKARKS